MYHMFHNLPLFDSDHVIGHLKVDVMTQVTERLNFPKPIAFPTAQPLIRSFGTSGSANDRRRWSSHFFVSLSTCGVAALHFVGDGSYHFFVYISTCGTSGYAWCGIKVFIYF